MRWFEDYLQAEVGSTTQTTITNTNTAQSGPQSLSEAFNVQPPNRSPKPTQSDKF